MFILYAGKKKECKKKELESIERVSTATSVSCYNVNSFHNFNMWHNAVDRIMLQLRLPNKHCYELVRK